MTIRHRMFAALACGALLAPVAGLAEESADSATGGDIAAYVEELDELFEKARLDVRASGLVYGVVADGRLVHSRAFGVRDQASGAPVTTDTAFRIASMTKMMTAQMVVDLQAEGQLYLDAPAELYLPELADWTYPTADSRKVTVRDLLNHTAGFITDNPWADRQMDISQETFSEMLETAEPFSYAPGAMWDYSNLGFAMSGRIIENLSGQTFGERLHEKILDPLGMESSGLEYRDIPEDGRAVGYNWINNAFVEEPVLASGAFDPLGGVWTTASDYGRYIGWMLSAWPARDDPDEAAIPRHVVRSVTDGVHMFGVSQPGGQADSCSIASAYSMGLNVSSHCTLGLLLAHGGGFPGYGSYVIMAPEQGFGVFVFTNKTYGSSRGAVWDAMLILDDGGFGQASPAPEADPRMLTAYERVGAAYAAGAFEGTGLTFADNFFLDRSLDRWLAQMDAIKAQAGDCETDAELITTSRLSGEFEWRCATARVAGHIIMSPLNPADLQELHLRAVTIGWNGREIITDIDFH